MKTKGIAMMLIILSLFGCKQRAEKEKQLELLENAPAVTNAFVHQGMIKIWETPDTLDVPESALPVPGVGIFVSNVGGKPLEKDGNGYITRLSEDGKIMVRRWATGLDAPKGMAISGGLLFVSDIDQLVAIRLENGEVEQRFPAPESKFLNDVTVDNAGNVYVSDMGASAIYRLSDGDFSLWLKDKRLESVNGLLVYDSILYAGTKDQVLSIVPGTRDIRVYVDHTGPVDGLVHFQGKQFIISDWSGHIFLVEPGKDPVKLLDTTPVHINAADIGYDASKNLLLVPTFSDNRIVAYRMNI